MSTMEQSQCYKGKYLRKMKGEYYEEVLVTYFMLYNTYIA